MDLSSLEKINGNRQTKKRVGRGPGSGLGKTSGRGHKGQKARTGKHIPPWFEGGQMPLQRRLPKFGFTNIFKKEIQVVNIKDLEKIANQGEITPELMYNSRLIRKKKVPVKILGEGDVSIKMSIKAHAFSQSAKEKIEKAGGMAEVIQ